MVSVPWASHWTPRFLNMTNRSDGPTSRVVVKAHGVEVANLKEASPPPASLTSRLWSAGPSASSSAHPAADAAAQDCSPGPVSEGSSYTGPRSCFSTWWTE